MKKKVNRRNKDELLYLKGTVGVWLHIHSFSPVSQGGGEGEKAQLL